MTISDYIECLNKAFEARYKDAEGWFVYTMNYEKTSFPIYKKLIVKIFYYQVGKENEEVFNFTFLDKVPSGKELEFEKQCLQEIISTVTYKIELVWHYGERDNI